MAEKKFKVKRTYSLGRGKFVISGEELTESEARTKGVPDSLLLEINIVPIADTDKPEKVTSAKKVRKPKAKKTTKVKDNADDGNRTNDANAATNEVADSGQGRDASEPSVG